MHTASALATAAATLPPATAAMPSAPVGWHELAPHRAALVAYARRRLMDPALAEDLVHDVFEAVVSGRAAFGGRSALRSWLVGVLKHKIVDLVRERSGHDSLEALADDEHEGGGWSPTCPQPRPDEVAEQRQRLSRTLQRIAALPDGLRRVVELRLLDDDSSADVCEALDISESNLFVRLHRARRLLAS